MIPGVPSPPVIWRLKVNRMKSFLLAGVLLAGSATAALASPIPIGTITITGTAIGVGSGAKSGIQYTTDPASSSNGTGILVGYGAAGNVTFSTPFIFSSLQTDPGQQLFSITSGGNTLTFDITGFDNVGGTYYSIGTVSINGTEVGTGVAGETFTGGAGNLGQDYTGTLTIDALPGVTPEPSSFILLGTGLLAIGGAATWRRRTAGSDSFGGMAAA
jgi:hypothetical protein